MRSPLLRSPFSRWALLLLLLASTLAPGLSRALASAQRLPWMPVCSVDGAATSGKPPAGPVHLASDHCPYCSAAQAQPALPPAVAAALWPIGPDIAPLAPALPPLPAWVPWPTSQARAPPPRA